MRLSSQRTTQSASDLKGGTGDAILLAAHAALQTSSLMFDGRIFHDITKKNRTITQSIYIYESLFVIFFAVRYLKVSYIHNIS